MFSPFLVWKRKHRADCSFRLLRLVLPLMLVIPLIPPPLLLPLHPVFHPLNNNSPISLVRANKPNLPPPNRHPNPRARHHNRNNPEHPSSSSNNALTRVLTDAEIIPCRMQLHPWKLLNAPSVICVLAMHRTQVVEADAEVITVEVANLNNNQPNNLKSQQLISISRV